MEDIEKRERKREQVSVRVRAEFSSKRNVLEGRRGIDHSVGPQRGNHLVCAGSFSS